MAANAWCPSLNLAAVNRILMTSRLSFELGSDNRGGIKFGPAVEWPLAQVYAGNAAGSSKSKVKRPIVAQLAHFWSPGAEAESRPREARALHRRGARRSADCGTHRRRTVPTGNDLSRSQRGRGVTQVIPPTGSDLQPLTGFSSGCAHAGDMTSKAKLAVPFRLVPAPTRQRRLTGDGVYGARELHVDRPDQIGRQPDRGLSSASPRHRRLAGRGVVRTLARRRSPASPGRSGPVSDRSDGAPRRPYRRTSRTATPWSQHAPRRPAHAEAAHPSRPVPVPHRQTSAKPPATNDNRLLTL